MNIRQNTILPFPFHQGEFEYCLSELEYHVDQIEQSYKEIIFHVALARGLIKQILSFQKSESKI